MSQAGVGVIFAGEGNYEEARRRLEESLRLDPAQPEAQSNMCADLVHLGRAGEAAAHCTQGLKMRPEYGMAGEVAGKGKRDCGEPSTRLTQPDSNR